MSFRICFYNKIDRFRAFYSYLGYISKLLYMTQNLIAEKYSKSLLQISFWIFFHGNGTNAQIITIKHSYRDIADF